MEHVNENKRSEATSVAISRIADLLGVDAAEAAKEASGVLDVAPGQRQALIVLVSALRLLGHDDVAREMLEWMAEERPRLAAPRYELGMLLAKAATRRESIAQLSQVVQLEPNHPTAWRTLGDQLSLNGALSGAGKAYARHIKLSLRELKLLDELEQLGVSELGKIEGALRASLDVNPTDVMTLRTLGRVCMRLMRYREAQVHLSRALELAPDYTQARETYAYALNFGARHREANEQFDILAQGDNRRRNAFKLQKIPNLMLLGDYDEAFRILDSLRNEESANPLFWLQYGHALGTVAGRGGEARDAYRKCLELDPQLASGWLALAHLKKYRFSPAEIETMQGLAARDDLEAQYLLHFALGQALENEARYSESFEQYRRGNSLVRPQIKLDTTLLPDMVKATRAVMTNRFFASKAGSGCSAADPIFIVGMARAGSTLIEQILASHSLIEGTRELPEIIDIVADLHMRYRDSQHQYPSLLTVMDEKEFKILGERYLESTRAHRTLDRPFFTDKAGENFMHVGLIQLILPNAKIIDARRHPLGCCFSCYKQTFPVGSIPESYDLADMARHYRGYVEMMAHYDKVLPGRIHRVFYEDVLRDPESEVRRLLTYCRLPFEEGCLRFYESDRAVRTISSQQVREPINRDAGEKWRHYEPWLGAAKEVLGDVLARYPDVPAFD
ncbi:MAG TPA: sulfotransferase [Rhizomicrobium sp.]|nr:sulfotransferase [Rhizomicrobium sp.]